MSDPVLKIPIPVILVTSIKQNRGRQTPVCSRRYSGCGKQASGGILVCVPGNIGRNGCGLVARIEHRKRFYTTTEGRERPRYICGGWGRGGQVCVCVCVIGRLFFVPSRKSNSHEEMRFLCSLRSRRSGTQTAKKLYSLINVVSMR